jgi:spermidine/putrescine transport system substrate-binding protein
VREGQFAIGRERQGENAMSPIRSAQFQLWASRRQFLKTSGAAVAAAAAGSILGRPAQAAREKELNILCWEGYNSAQVLDPFRSQQGATVKAESLTNDPTMINRLRAGETNVWDLINVNNPWARKIMQPEGLIKPLDRAKFEPYFEKMLPAFKPPYRWAMSDDGKELLGMCQRFGPYSFVVNTDKVSRETAEDQGWDLWNDPKNAGKYGVLESDDWNVFNLCLIAGFDPFRPHTDDEVAKFDETAKRVFKGAKLVGDIATMNQAFISGEIDFHMTGGTYSASPARADGATNVRGVTPKRGPMDGKGGVSWIEVTSTVNNPQLSPLATQFLEYVQQPATAHTVAFAEGTFNPVAQMANPDCFKLFTPEELDAIQWDSLDEEMARSVEYDIVPDYDKLLDVMTAAKRAAAGG